ncbi:Guanine nucleotide-binding protein alpha-2 subunit [Spiromyces aspiralis]|uniref:Guanine nucleotide-binding protein alpha-2 subunit n=1 Tax=Spiromyces aspiralis TaxID=68401 RepID=A0ACC1HDG5_9FUNG|nr:Guanine nucleotide-binding protein alpha-2 subunit [Spiromyces aspiralis]
MGVCMSHEKDLDALRSAEIDRHLEEERDRRNQEVKILLLGSGESGKSTIVKQMKIIHQNGYTKEELAMFRPTIYKNVIDSAHELVTGMQICDMWPENEENRAFAEELLELDENSGIYTGITRRFVDSMELLWRDLVIPRLLVRSSDFYIMDSAPYFFSNIRRIGSDDYLPTEADVLRSRSKTTGIIETRFIMGHTSIQ